MIESFKCECMYVYICVYVRYVFLFISITEILSYLYSPEYITLHIVYEILNKVFWK